MTNPANEDYHMSDDGLAMLKDFEGYSSKAYRDRGDVWTIGWGTTNENGHSVQPGDKITKAQATAYLKHDMLYFENVVKRDVKVPLTQHEFDAMVDFTYNLGEGNLAKSDVLKLLNRSNYDIVPALMKHWTGGPPGTFDGLLRRRTAEGILFSTGMHDVIAPPEPEKHDDGTHAGLPSGVQPTGYTPQQWSFGELLTQSDTVKGVLVSVTGLCSTVGAFFEPLMKNPLLFGVLAVTALGLGYIFFVKARDTSQGR